MSQEKAKQPEYRAELKVAAVQRVLAGESVSAVAQELGIRRKRLYVWKDRYAELGEAGLVHRRGSPGYFDTDVDVEKSFNLPNWRLPSSQLERDSLTCSIILTLLFRIRTPTATSSGRSNRPSASRQPSTALDLGPTLLRG